MNSDRISDFLITLRVTFREGSRVFSARFQSRRARSGSLDFYCGPKSDRTNPAGQSGHGYLSSFLKAFYFIAAFCP